MEFENTFTVAAPIDEVWDAVLDLERVAPCVPGAQVLEKTSDNAYKVAIKVKLGPIVQQYKGDVEILESDPGEHRAVMSAKAREARGQGTANARVTMTLEEVPEGTRGTSSADVQLSGKAASMGRGMIQEVSSKIVGQFSDNLAEMLGNGAAPEAAAEPTPEPVAPSAPSPEEKAQEPKQEPEPLDIGELGGGLIAARMQDPKVLAGALGAAFALGWLLGRRTS